MIRIALLRHFPTDWNAGGRLQGRRDIPLSAAGRADLAQHRLPEDWAGCPVVSSPLARARETAQTLGRGPVRLDDRLIEMDFGAWEGRTAQELESDPQAQYRPLEDWGWDFAPPGGESAAALAERLCACLAELDGPTLVVTHRGVIRCALALASGWGYRGPQPFRIKRASLHPVSLGNDGMPMAYDPPERLAPRMIGEAPR
ncbi:MAG: histidine phosphatase family protein [Pseudomonadota bacterium]